MCIRDRVGGRGKAGGVRFAQDAQELQQHAESILGMDIKGHIVKKLLIVEKVDIAKELYLSMMLDRLTKCPIIIFSAQGGMDIEQVARETPDQVLKLAVDPLMGINAFQARYLVDKSGLDSALVQPLLAVLRKLYKMFLSCDCMLAEINPLVIDGAGNLIAADGKVSVDDSALYRQPDILEMCIRDRLVVFEEPQRLVFKAPNLVHGAIDLQLAIAIDHFSPPLSKPSCARISTIPAVDSAI